MCNLGDDLHEESIEEKSAKVGWRWFRILDNTGLFPLYSYSGWDRKVCAADRKPRWSAGCLGLRNGSGLYIFNDRATALANKPPNSERVWAGFDPRSIVLAKVRFWGECVKHERGYRAEFAKVEKVVYGLGQWRGLSRAKLGIPKHVRYSLQVRLPINQGLPLLEKPRAQ